MSAGFFHCEHCCRVVELSALEIEAAEASPDGQLRGLKCPACHRHTVDWHPPATRKAKRPAPQPVDPERAKEWFKQIYDSVNL